MKKSHECEFAVPDVLKWIGSIVTPVAVFALVMHLGSTLNLFPRPRPALDVDRTILLHQAEASRSQQNADVVLIGDSSCLMDVSAPRLSAALANRYRALNLGTLSYLDLSTYASMLQQYIAVNPNRVRTVVLLMHPEALRRSAPEEHHLEILKRYYAGVDYCDASSPAFECWMGGAIFKGRFLSRFMPVPLDGPYGRTYGFATDLWEYLTTHDGSAIDPRKFDRSTAQGDAVYHLAARLEPASQDFRFAVPNGVKLFVGITPAPESFVARDYRQRRQDMLSQWNHWLRADGTLAELPGILPDDLFASTTHLNEAGQKVYTEALAQSLGRNLSSQ